VSASDEQAAWEGLLWRLVPNWMPESREHLVGLLMEAGATVQLPPGLRPRPGATGTATAQGMPGTRVVRVGDQVYGGYAWLAPNSMDPWLTADEVIDFVPDVVLTEADRDALLGRFKGSALADVAARVVITLWWNERAGVAS
jgi:hypothetical protein